MIDEVARFWILMACWLVGGIVSTVFYYRMWGQKAICKSRSQYLRSNEFYASGSLEKARQEASFVMFLPFFWWILLILAAIFGPLLWIIDKAEKKWPEKEEADKNRPFVDWFIGRSCD